MGSSKSTQNQRIDQIPPPQCIKQNDIFRFLGKWYDIAGIPTFYTSRCKNTNSTYSLNFDGSIKIQTSLVRWGIHFNSQFTAQSTNRQNTKLKIKLCGPLNIIQIYRIVLIGQNYQYFVMSDQAYEELYIFYRQPQMPHQLYDAILVQLEANQGFKLSKLVKISQKKSMDHFNIN